LPSYAKTHDERFVNSLQAFKGKVSEILKGNLKAGFGISKSADEQAVLGGSTTNSFAKQRVIPVRFAGRMDMEKQSADIPTMLLAFNIAALEYNEMSKDQPLLESIRAHVEGLPVQEIRKLVVNSPSRAVFSCEKPIRHPAKGW
jgi:hypothetical protein